MPPFNGHTGGAGGQSAPEALTIDERRTQVAHLLASRRTQREMADTLGVAQSTIGQDVKAIRAEWRREMARDYNEFLAEELAKLAQLERAVLPEAIIGGKPDDDGNKRPSMWAVDRVLAIMDRRARMLGLDAPSKVEVNLRVELVVRALEGTLRELGVPVEEARPVLGRQLRELGAVAES